MQEIQNYSALFSNRREKRIIAVLYSVRTVFSTRYENCRCEFNHRNRDQPNKSYVLHRNVRISRVKRQGNFIVNYSYISVSSTFMA